ncbi:antibiotic biosynthesis monooxygenase family protein [Acinetobacter rudis]|uniref:Antibiotic biosynthesis monooxygenase n=1 Tax=Acinetobacter rudis TaxID=632955 RepID=A0AAW8J9C1_9GAMM|nr:antibiotic biosynthesis monooxygenase [Acinetobacter rudis]MDQ8936097.1 antibiotic biosynthesis monooxygenase [Acinetobacter rudis]MDQ8952790.1 antibiotic biosynthesis monooxygenase [Acinetobacter rudis]MDQ9018360.1 antibiotic biosynthesis monooxygenase [Acinetobacter rudis]
MILEHVELHILPCQSEAFEQAMQQAKNLIAEMPGFLSLQLLKHHQLADRYLLCIQWQRIEDHQQGFRASAQYQQWKALLHHFYPMERKTSSFRVRI